LPSRSHNAAARAAVHVHGVLAPRPEVESVPPGSVCIARWYIASWRSRARGWGGRWVRRSCVPPGCGPQPDVRPGGGWRAPASGVPRRTAGCAHPGRRCGEWNGIADRATRAGTSSTRISSHLSLQATNPQRFSHDPSIRVHLAVVTRHGEQTTRGQARRLDAAPVRRGEAGGRRLLGHTVTRGRSDRPLTGLGKGRCRRSSRRFTGLWTAIRCWNGPSLRVAILEADRIGEGASGRNGGFCAAP